MATGHLTAVATLLSMNSPADSDLVAHENQMGHRLRVSCTTYAQQRPKASNTMRAQGTQDTCNDHAKYGGLGLGAKGRSVWVGMDGLQRGLFGLALNSLADDGKTVDQFVRHNLVNHSKVSPRDKEAPWSLTQHAVPFLVMLIDTRD